MNLTAGSSQQAGVSIRRREDSPTTGKFAENGETGFALAKTGGKGGLTRGVHLAPVPRQVSARSQKNVSYTASSTCNQVPQRYHIPLQLRIEVE